MRERERERGNCRDEVKIYPSMQKWESTISKMTDRSLHFYLLSYSQNYCDI